ncbi:MAG: hypothetical protein ACI9YU_000894, partial [Flavobacteriales bacterium]
MVGKKGLAYFFEIVKTNVNEDVIFFQINIE